MAFIAAISSASQAYAFAQKIDTSKAKTDAERLDMEQARRELLAQVMETFRGQNYFVSFRAFMYEVRYHIIEVNRRTLSTPEVV